jgi:hypothetical protein
VEEEQEWLYYVRTIQKSDHDDARKTTRMEIPVPPSKIL